MTDHQRFNAIPHYDGKIRTPTSTSYRNVEHIFEMPTHSPISKQNLHLMTMHRQNIVLWATILCQKRTHLVVSMATTALSIASFTSARSDLYLDRELALS